MRHGSQAQTQQAMLMSSADAPQASVASAVTAERIPKILVNRPESKSFIATALTWRGSVSPRVFSRVLVTASYALLAQVVTSHVPHIVVPITPFEYSGAVLALILVLRVNAGHDRWWEARKIWGAIVNQSRNLALVIKAYAAPSASSQELLNWVAAWPHIMRESLRQERNLKEVEGLLGPSETERVRKAGHMPNYAGLKIANLLAQLKDEGLDAWAFLRAETERSQLIDAIGACERIRSTRMPLVLAIKTRRFILMFLLLLPFALVDRAGWLTALVVALAAYPLFCLDEIGAELQNPFSPRNLSHLPLDEICSSITKNILEIKNS